MLPQWIIEKKRDGQALSGSEIADTIGAYTRGELPDYQMAALAMAIYFQGMSLQEILDLTGAMLHSGEVLDLAALGRPSADKHSTGGIGDKVSLILAPLVACCGVAVPMLSGRGLGITGGTLDKLESIPGYRTDLSRQAFMHVLDTCGCSIMGQTETLAPADRKLYALRDVTGTVPCIPLIVASIMSKKLAEGTDALVLDVKCGSGAFMQAPQQARELADTLVAVGERMGKRVTALLTDMNQPLGRTAGNALEVREVIDALQGRGPVDLIAVTLELSAHMLLLTGIEDTRAAALARLTRTLSSGEAFERFKTMVRLHGGDPRTIDQPDLLPSAPLQWTLTAPAAGVVTGVDALGIGKAAAVLGAGRAKVDDHIDPAVGISHMVKTGETVARGDTLAVLHASGQAALAEAQPWVTQAIRLGPQALPPTVLILETIQGKDPHAQPQS